MIEGTAVELGVRVSLSLPTADDCHEFVELMRQSRSYHRPWSAPPTERDSYHELLARAGDPDFELFLCCRLEDGAIVGYFELSQIVRRHFQSAVLGYNGSAPYAGEGYMSEGIELLLRHAFLSMRLHRVEANIQPGNLPSLALAQRAGFRREGFSPRYLKIGGRWRDHERYAILAEDWRDQRRRRPGPLGTVVELPEPEPPE
jgi:[ribosomal protein S5]-alanine N-acetyltransferase